MKKIKITLNIDNYLHNTPLKIKSDLFQVFGGMEDLTAEAISTLQNSLINNRMNLRDTNQWLYTHSFETIEAMYTDDSGTSVQYLDQMAEGFQNLCIDLHDAVIPNITQHGFDVDEIRVNVDKVDTHGYYNGAVGDELTVYLTCTWGSKNSGPYINNSSEVRRRFDDATFSNR